MKICWILLLFGNSAKSEYIWIHIEPSISSDQQPLWQLPRVQNQTQPIANFNFQCSWINFHFHFLFFLFYLIRQYKMFSGLVGFTWRREDFAQWEPELWWTTGRLMSCCLVRFIIGTILINDHHLDKNLDHLNLDGLSCSSWASWSYWPPTTGRLMTCLLASMIILTLIHV